MTFDKERVDFILSCMHAHDDYGLWSVSVFEAEISGVGPPKSFLYAVFASARCLTDIQYIVLFHHFPRVSKHPLVLLHPPLANVAGQIMRAARSMYYDYAYVCAVCVS